MLTEYAYSFVSSCAIIHLGCASVCEDMQYREEMEEGKVEMKVNKNPNLKRVTVTQSGYNVEVVYVYGVVSFLTGSAGLFGDRQGDLREGKDVDFGAILGGRRGQGGEICLVLLSLSVFKLLVQGHMLRLVIHSEPYYH